MPVVVSFASQKGGVGKSTLARALASVAAHGGIKVLLADLDPQQNTVLRWEKLRRGNEELPALAVKGFRSVEEAIAAAAEFDLVVIDAPGSTTRATLDLARHSHLLVQPTGPSLDDLDPSILLFHELAAAGVPKERLVLALCRTLTRAEEDEARSYLEAAGYSVLRASIPERAPYRAAQNRGYAVTETKERALNERADLLLSELMSKVGDAIAALRRQAKKKSGKEGVA